jgi:dephospho-CoA kinase
MPVLKIGLTGGLASGKSTVARRLAAAGLTVVDADRLVAELYQPGAAGSAAVAELFGHGLLAADGAVDKARLAALVFSDPDSRRRLEAAIHPLVRRRFAELAQDATGGIVLEATRLVEAGYGPEFDLVVTIESEPHRQFERAVARGLAADEARARLHAQGDGAARRAGAQVTLRNDGGLAELEAQVDRLVARLGAAAGPRSSSP